jgi:hypothetical protein
LQDPIIILFLCLVFGAMAIAGMIMASKARRARTDAMAAFAARNGWSFLAGPLDGDGGLFSSGGARCGLEPFHRFPFFEDGHDREFSNVMGGELAGAGEGGVRMTCEAGDYTWTTGSGKNARTHKRSYLVFDLSAELGNVPDLGIRPEGWSDRLFDVFAGGGGDIDFESEEFSRRFHVTSSDRRFAFAVIDPRMMEFLMSTSQQVLEMRGGWGLVVSQGDEWDPRDFAWAAGGVREFVDHWPAYLVKECREQRW